MHDAQRSFPAVAIAACGAVTAVGSGIEALRTALRANTSGLRPSERFSSSRYQSNIVGAVFRNDDGGEDPAFELANRALLEAREQAQDILGSIPPERLGF